MRLLDLELCPEVVAEQFFLSGFRVSQSDSSRGVVAGVGLRVVLVELLKVTKLMVLIVRVVVGL